MREDHHGEGAPLLGTIESEVRAGESFEVLNRGRVAAHVVPPQPRPALQWPDHGSHRRPEPWHEGVGHHRLPTSRAYVIYLEAKVWR